MNTKKNKYILLRQLVYDFKTGIMLEWKQYVFLLIFIILFCFHFLHKINIYSYLNPLDKPNFSDYLVALFKGKEYFDVLTFKDTFTLPAVWMTVNFYLAIIISIYPMKDYNERGYQFLLRVEKKSYWWISKCIWVIFSVSLYYGILYFVLFLFSCYSGGLSFSPNNMISTYISEINIENINTVKFILITIVAPIAVSISLSLLELTLSFIFNPMAAILMIIIYQIASAYWCKYFLVGNYTMICRNSVIIGSKGVNSGIGIIICVIISMFSVIAGYLIFKNVELTSKKVVD